MNEPEVLLLDEPLGALDLKLRQEMQVELKRIQRQVGITFIYVTHDQEEALTMSDRVAVFRSGQIEQIGPPIEVYERPATQFVASFVGTSNVITTPSGQAVLRPEKVEISQAPLGEGHPGTNGIRVGCGLPRHGHSIHRPTGRRRHHDGGASESIEQH